LIANILNLFESKLFGNILTPLFKEKIGLSTFALSPLKSLIEKSGENHNELRQVVNFGLIDRFLLIDFAPLKKFFIQDSWATFEIFSTCPLLNLHLAQCEFEAFEHLQSAVAVPLCTFVNPFV
jgi:hypothetical protein